MAVPQSGIDQLTAITNKHFMPTLPDLVFDANPLLKLIPKRTAPGGDKIAQPLLYQFTKDGAYFDYAKGSTDAEDQITDAFYPWKNYRQRIVISIPEIRRNSGPEALFNLLKTKMQGASTAIKDAIVVDAYLNTSIDTSAGVNSIPNILGDGTFPTDTTSGGIDKSLASGAFFRGKTKDHGANLLGLHSEMLDLWYSIIDGDDIPNMIISHPTPVQNHQEEATSGGQALSRFVNTNEMKSGFTTITFQGQPWYMDRHLAAAPGDGIAGMFMLNTKYWSLVEMKNERFRFSGFMTPTNQNVQIGWIYWMGNFTSSDPSRSGMMHT
jgi:hypothetical protein